MHAKLWLSEDIRITFIVTKKNNNNDGDKMQKSQKTRKIQHNQKVQHILAQMTCMFSMVISRPFNIWTRPVYLELVV